MDAGGVKNSAEKPLSLIQVRSAIGAAGEICGQAGVPEQGPVPLPGQPLAPGQLGVELPVGL